jgi:hypothetical protein
MNPSKWRILGHPEDSARIDRLELRAVFCQRGALGELDLDALLEKYAK